MSKDEKEYIITRVISMHVTASSRDKAEEQFNELIDDAEPHTHNDNVAAGWLWFNKEASNVHIDTNIHLANDKLESVRTGVAPSSIKKQVEDDINE